MLSLRSLFVLTLLFVNLTSSTIYIGRRDAQFGTDVFTGIPFAQPAVRLQPSVELSGDQGTVDASSPISKRCLEVGSSASILEDCLTLDLVRPSNPLDRIESNGDPVTITINDGDKNKRLLPVYVFIHGYGHISTFTFSLSLTAELTVVTSYRATNQTAMVEIL